MYRSSRKSDLRISDSMNRALNMSVTDGQTREGFSEEGMFKNED